LDVTRPIPLDQFADLIGDYKFRDKADRIRCQLLHRNDQLTAGQADSGLIPALAGCATVASDVVPIGRDTYQLSMTGVGFATQANTNIKALKAANAYCEKMNKHMEFQHNSESGVYGWSPRQDNLVFMCLNADDPEYARTKVQRDPNVIIQEKDH